ncbi:MAG: TetR/AcrR family transcriptional regulator [Methanosarcina barkeri]|nr:TetR/AcrR family transcriptional regulator [Methanosarcina sp. ERenArc_MAG2]
MKIFASEGYTGATTRRIAEEANVAEVTLFRKFQSKENLLREVLIQNRTAFSALDTLFLIEKNADLETDLRILGKNIIKVMKDKKMMVNAVCLCSCCSKKGGGDPKSPRFYHLSFK